MPKLRLFPLCLALLWLTQCAPSPITPNPPPIVTPAPAPIWFGVSDNASELADRLPPLNEALPNIRLNFIINERQALLTDLENGFLDALLVHHIPPGDYWHTPIAIDGAAIILHPDNPITNLTLSQIREIFAGNIDNWAQVGGENAPITLLGRDADAGIRAILIERALGERRPSINSRIVATDQQMRQAVSLESTAIGYSMMSGGEAEVKFVPIAGILPTPITTANQSYPLTTPLYLISLHEPQGAFRIAVAWLQSAPTQSLLSPPFGHLPSP